MKVGDKVKFNFAGNKKEGTVNKLFDKSVYLKGEFDNHKHKTVKRKFSEIDGSKAKKKK